MNIYQISYISTSAKVFDEPALQMLLQKSRARNAGSNITGALIYNLGQFLQFLEGPEDVVTKLYKKINHDSRHNEIQMIYEGFAVKRMFGEWDMAYKNIAEYDESLRAGVIDLVGSISRSETLYKQEQVIRVFDYLSKAA